MPLFGSAINAADVFAIISDNPADATSVDVSAEVRTINQKANDDDELMSMLSAAYAITTQAQKRQLTAAQFEATLVDPTGVPVEVVDKQGLLNKAVLSGAISAITAGELRNRMGTFANGEDIESIEARFFQPAVSSLAIDGNNVNLAEGSTVEYIQRVEKRELLKSSSADDLIDELFNPTNSSRLQDEEIIALANSTEGKDVNTLDLTQPAEQIGLKLFDLLNLPKSPAYATYDCSKLCEKIFAVTKSGHFKKPELRAAINRLGNYSPGLADMFAMFIALESRGCLTAKNSDTVIGVKGGYGITQIMAGTWRLMRKKYPIISNALGMNWRHEHMAFSYASTVAWSAWMWEQEYVKHGRAGPLIRSTTNRSLKFRTLLAYAGWWMGPGSLANAYRIITEYDTITDDEIWTIISSKRLAGISQSFTGTPYTRSESLAIVRGVHKNIKKATSDTFWIA